MTQRKYKILVVEDEDPLRKAITDEFTNHGFDVLEASDGKEGLSVAKAKHPDIILLDILMPVMNGFEMLTKLRKDPWGKEAKVIILTVVGTDDTIIKKIDKLEPTFYLIKSNWKLGEIVSKVKSLL